MRWLAGLLLLLGLVLPVQALVTHDLPAGADERDAILGDFSAGYVVSGCDAALPASGLTLTLPPCAAYTLETSGGRALKYTREAAAHALSIPNVDATVWLAVRWQVGATPAGWTAVAGTPYLWRTSATRPPAPSGVLLTNRYSVVGGALTEHRRLFATNPFNPGRIYATDPYIGARCDGATDDSPALQRALDLARERGGATVELPEGTCVAAGLVIDNATLGTTIPSGVDDRDFRAGCASLVGQGPGKTILTPPDTVQSETYVLHSACTPLGAGQFDVPYPGNFPGAVLLADFSIYGRQNRQLEHHGLLVEGGYPHVRDVQIHSVNGHGLVIGKHEKLESGWFTGMHVRASGRYVTDGGRGDGLPGSSNNAALLFAEPANLSRNNNLTFVGLQVGYPWYTGIEMDCEPATFGTGNVWFFGSMLHGHEGDAATNQGRLNKDTGLVWLHGACFNISFITGNANTPGSDAPATNDPTGPPAAVFHLDDIEGDSTTGPDAVYISDIYGNRSVSGQLVRISAARAVVLTGIRAGSDPETDYPDGQLVVTPAQELDPENPQGNDVLTLVVCQNVFSPALTSMAYSDAGKIRDCGRETYSARILADSQRLLPLSSASTWTIGAGGAAVTKNHGLPCTPTAAQVTLTLTDEPDNCVEPWVSNIGATSFDINCVVGPATVGGDGVSGAVTIALPQGCTPAELLTLWQDPLFGSLHRTVFIQGITWTTSSPGVAVDAAHFATITLAKRKLLSEEPFAQLSTKTTGLLAWTPQPLTILDLAELLWNPSDTLSLTITKSCATAPENIACTPTGNGVALPAGILTIQIGTNVLANK